SAAADAAQPAHHPPGRSARDRRLHRLQPADPATALLVAGLSPALSRLAQPRRRRPVRHGDLDAPDVGLPGAELPDRDADPRPRLALGDAPDAPADCRRAMALRRARWSIDPPADRSRAALRRGPSRHVRRERRLTWRPRRASMT